MVNFTKLSKARAFVRVSQSIVSMVVGGVLFCGVMGSTYGQTIIRGQVLDGASSEPLAFAQVLYDSTERVGITADLNGEFTIRTRRPVSYIRVSYIGYKTRVIKLNLPVEGPLRIRLQPNTLQTEEVWIIAEKNPAERIIRKVISNKNINNPEKIEAYSCEIYNKTIYDFLPNKESPPRDQLQTRQDSNLYSLHQFARESALFIMESFSDRKYKAPDQLEERVNATRVSGFKHPTFASLATDFQPFSFYQEIIPLFDKLYINPISNGSLNRYDFRLTDTLFQDLDTVYVIEYKPKKGKNFDGLEGVLYVNTFQYAIQNVIAAPADQGPMEINIEQLYTCVDRKQWFPGELHFEIVARNYPTQTVGMRISGKNYVRNIELAPAFASQDFTFRSVSIAPDAAQMSEKWWDSVRTHPLTAKEQRTYVRIDSIGEERNFDRLMRQMEKLSNNRLGVSFLDIDIDKLFLYNEYEGNRIGLGLHTNERVSSWWEIGGYIGYGFRDKGLKYGGDLTFFLSRPYETAVGVSYSNDVLMPGLSKLEPQSGLTNLRSYTASRMDIIQKKAVFAESRLFSYGHLFTELSSSQRQAGYDYEFDPQNGEANPKEYPLTHIFIRFRYAWKEKIVESFGQNVSLGSKYPILTLGYTRGLSGWLNGMYDYQKFELQLEQDFQTKRWGKSSVFVRAGYVDRALPAGLLFHGAGSQIGDIWALIPRSFQTMKPFEFLSDQYLEAYWVQDFGSLLFKTKWLKPRIQYWQGIGIGKLSNPEFHKGIDFGTMEKGYFESGLVLQQLLRTKLVNLVYMGLGGGIFYRYGAYHLPALKDNLAFKLAVNFSMN